MKHAVIIEIAFAVLLALTGAVVLAPPRPVPTVTAPICNGPPCNVDDPLEIAPPTLNRQQEPENGMTRPF